MGRAGEWQEKRQRGGLQGLGFVTGVSAARTAAQVRVHIFQVAGVTASEEDAVGTGSAAMPAHEGRVKRV
eukprot:646187-Pelagomonas_calceolata.AAC.3